MSGGGAGKVYFVLYLAVVLELLIIIVERDEAEEHLHQKQKEAMKIVESILSQLQAGAGTDQMNTKPKDEITIAPKGIDFEKEFDMKIKADRKYTLLVGVTDVSREAKRKEGEPQKEFEERLKKLVKQTNVEEIEYDIFYNPGDDPEVAPPFPSDNYIEENKWDFLSMEPGTLISDEGGEQWKFLGSRKLILDFDKTYEAVNVKKASTDPMHPAYKESLVNGEVFKPDGITEDSVFYYDAIATKSLVGQSGKAGLQQRAFVLNFQPPANAGWYKLRIYSRANKILGISSGIKRENLDHNMTVKVGTVNLKVKELEKIKKNLEIELDKFNLPKEDVLYKPNGSKKWNEMIAESQALADEEEDATKIRSSIKLYGYIGRLLTPGASVDFEQNKGSIVYDIRVLTPKPPLADPVISFNSEMHAFDASNVNFKFSISPYRENQNVLKGYVFDEVQGTSGSPLAEVSIRPVNETSPTDGKARQYYGTINKKLMAGENGTPRRYLVRMEHSLSSKSSDSTSVLTIYPSQIETDVTKMGVIFEALATYGSNLFFNYQPPSGRNILPERFGYYFSTDADPQEPGLRPGFTAEVKDGLTFPANANEATLKIVWIDPITKEEVEIFSEKTVDIRQEAPKVNTAFANVDVAGEDRLKVRISNITVTQPPAGTDGETADVTLSVQDSKVKIPGYKMQGKAKVSKSGDKYTIDFDIVGEPNEDGIVSGTVELTLFAVAKNTINGKVSDPKRQKYTARVKYKLEQDNYYEEY